MKASSALGSENSITVILFARGSLIQRILEGGLVFADQLSRCPHCDARQEHGAVRAKCYGARIFVRRRVAYFQMHRHGALHCDTFVRRRDRRAAARGRPSFGPVRRPTSISFVEALFSSLARDSPPSSIA